MQRYTEFFDRGYWEFGTRKAEPSYDLFSVAMIMVNCAVKKEFKKTARPQEQLMSVIDGHPFLKRYKRLCRRPCDGADADEERAVLDWRLLCIRGGRPISRRSPFISSAVR